MRRAIIQVSGPPGSWLAARIADLTPDFNVFLFEGVDCVSVHSLPSFAVNFVYSILALPGRCLPSICKSHAGLTAQSER